MGPKKYLALVAINFLKKTVKDSLITGIEKTPQISFFWNSGGWLLESGTGTGGYQGGS